MKKKCSPAQKRVRRRARAAKLAPPAVAAKSPQRTAADVAEATKCAKTIAGAMHGLGLSDAACLLAGATLMFFGESPTARKTGEILAVNNLDALIQSDAARKDERAESTVSTALRQASEAAFKATEDATVRAIEQYHRVIDSQNALLGRLRSSAEKQRAAVESIGKTPGAR